MNAPLPAAALDQLFRTARSYNGWLDTPVSDEQIHAIYELLKMAPTSANQSPARFVWCKSAEAKARLAACAGEKNQPKITSAPVCVVIGHDQNFHEQLPWLFPHADAKSWFAGNEAFRHESAFRNGTLQEAYLIMAARAVGLDCGPMSGFDQAAASREFFADQPGVKADLICSIGYGDPASIFDRSPRPEFARFNSVI